MKQIFKGTKFIKRAFLFSLGIAMLSLSSCSKGSDDEEEEDDGPKGSITFYITTEPGCDAITINVQTQGEDPQKSWVGSISKTNLTTTTATCGMTTGYTFKNLPYGQYYFNASCGSRNIMGPIGLAQDCIIKNID